MPFIQLDQSPPTPPDKHNKIEHSPTGLFLLRRVEFDIVEENSDKSQENSSKDL